VRQHISAKSQIVHAPFRRHVPIALFHEGSFRIQTFGLALYRGCCGLATRPTRVVDIGRLAVRRSGMGWSTSGRMMVLYSQFRRFAACKLSTSTSTPQLTSSNAMSAIDRWGVSSLWSNTSIPSVTISKCDQSFRGRQPLRERR
jgi:hypothetical protein